MGALADVPEARVVLDIRDRVGARQELGLLGMAFHPDFARTGRPSTPTGAPEASQSRSHAHGTGASGPP